MAQWAAEHALASVWALVWHFGIIFGVMILALLWAWFMPLFKKTALWVALGAFIIAMTAGIYTKLGADHVQAKWDAANAAAARKAVDARHDAEVFFPLDFRAHADRVRNDGWDRDQRKSNPGDLRAPTDLLKLKGHR